MKAALPASSPSTIGPYEVVQVLGRGGMGVVYKARDAALDRWVAVKTLLPAMAGDPEARERFLREARAAAALSHPNLTQIYAIGEQDGTPYFAMEFIEGRTLSQEIERQGRLQPLQALRLARQVALGLQEAQRFQLIHRDIKPANLILTADGTVKITDFGLAKRAAGPASMQLTATGQAIGSPLYMSPEQARGVEVDHRSDIYSLGATLFHLLTGRPPFQAPSATEVVLKHLKEPVPSPRALAPQVSYPLAGVVQRMMRKRPEDRFPNYHALVEELERIEAGEGGGTTAPRVVPVWVRERPARSWVTLVGFVALCAAGALIGYRLVRSALQPWSGSGDASGGGAARAPGAAGEASGRAAPARRGESGPGTADPRRARGAAVLRVLDLSQEPMPPSGMRVRGRIVNEGGSPARGVSVQVRIFDAGGHLAGSEGVLPRPDPIEPGSIAIFEAMFGDAAGVARVSAEVSWSE